MLHAADGMIPSDMSLSEPEGLEEELRLFYVALTRAKQHLSVYFPLRYYHRRFAFDDSHLYAQLTRFLPKDVRVYFEETTAAGAVDPDDVIDLTEHGRAVSSVVDQLVKLWER